MTVGDRIKQTRCDLELSQTELAIRANYCDKTRISKIENSGNDISMKQVRRIAKALGVSSAYLMGWEDQPLDKAEDAKDRKIARGLEFCERFDNASPEVQSAIASLLGFDQSDS